MTRQPTQDELAQAFDSQSEGPPAAAAPVESANAVEPAKSEPLGVDVEALRQDFARTEAQLERTVASKGDPGAEAALVELERAAAALGPPYPARALRLRVQRARALGDAGAAAALASRWLNECGPEAVSRCRGQALGAIERAARQGALARWKQFAADARLADACVRDAEGAAARKAEDAPECLPHAQQFYARAGDRLMGSRLLFADGRIRFATHPERAFGRLEQAAQHCDEPRCRDVKGRILRLLSGAYLGRGEVELAARAALRGVDVHATSLPPQRRVYAWTPEASKACAAYDARAGAGACRSLERKIRGTHAFRDFSLESTRGEGLPPESVKEVNAHFGVTLQECLSAEAKRLQPPAEERYTVRWTVRNDGRVSELLMDRRDSNDGPLARCLRSQMSVWRYPRYEGELQHVEQTFLVVAR